MAGMLVIALQGRIQDFATGGGGGGLANLCDNSGVSWGLRPPKRPLPLDPPVPCVPDELHDQHQHQAACLPNLSSSPCSNRPSPRPTRITRGGGGALTPDQLRTVERMGGSTPWSPTHCWWHLPRWYKRSIPNGSPNRSPHDRSPTDRCPTGSTDQVSTVTPNPGIFLSGGGADDGALPPPLNFDNPKRPKIWYVARGAISLCAAAAAKCESTAIDYWIFFKAFLDVL